MTDTQTTFARVTLEYDKAHKRAPLEAITSRLSDCNAVVARTAVALLSVFTGKRLL
jgi:hypothetical protein